MSLRETAKRFEEKLKKIKVAIFDLDGILTDAHVWWESEEVGFNRNFNIYDGYGMKVLMEAGLRVGVITGGAGSMISDAVAMQLDAFITGEGAHHTFFDAMESGINVYYGGHYATETFGVRALAEHLSQRFDLPWEFIDLPTGL